MRIEVSLNNGIAVLRIQGKLWEEEDSIVLNQKIDESISKGCACFVADLRGVPIMNSSGLGSLIAAMKKVRSQSGEMALTGLNERLDQLFQITRLHTVFATYADVESAIKEMHTCS